MKIKCVRTSFESPWQNGIAERWVQSCRRDLPNHVIALDEAHLRRLLSDYVRYYHEDRTHLGLKKETPTGRIRSLASGRITARARLGSLHHRYDRAGEQHQPEHWHVLLTEISVWVPGCVMVGAQLL
jgi:putative transposase